MSLMVFSRVICCSNSSSDSLSSHFRCFEHVNEVIVNLKESEMVGFVYERFFEDHSSSNVCEFWDCRLLISEGETVFIIVGGL